MPNRLEWEDVQLRYKDALQKFLASKEKPAVDDAEVKEIPIITISDDNDAAMEVSAENVDDINSVKKPVDDNAVVAETTDDGVTESTAEAESAAPATGETEEAAAAVVVNPDSSITDKALTDTRKTEVYKFKLPNILSLTHSLTSLSLSIHILSLVLLLGSFFVLTLRFSARKKNHFYLFFDPIIKRSPLTSPPAHHHPSNWFPQSQRRKISLTKPKISRIINLPPTNLQHHPLKQNAFFLFFF